MSLINQVLRDLDARQAAAGGLRPLPSEVRPLPPAKPPRRPLLLAGAAALVLALGAAVHLYSGRDLPPPAARVPPPATEVAATPPLPPAATVATASGDTAVGAQDTAFAPVPIHVDSVQPVDKLGSEKRGKTPAGDGEKKAKPEAKVETRAEATSRPAKVADSSAGESSEPPSSPAAKSAKAPIERSDASGSPAERAESSYRKAIAALNQGRISEAEEQLRGVLREEALHRPARQLLAKVLIEARRIDEAIVVLQDGLQGQPAQIGWAMTLARLQVDRGDLAGAWKTLDDSLPAAGRSADYQGFAAHVLQRLGRQRDAIARYQAAARLAPGDGRWWLGLGLAHESEGNNAEAHDAFLHARQSGNLSPELAALVEQKLR